MNQAKFSETGGVVVWRASDTAGTPPPDILARFPGIVPEVPTIAEAGVPGYESYTWIALFGPKGLDAEIVNKVNAAVKAALENPATRDKLIALGNTPRWETIEQFTATVKRDRAKWAEVVKAVGAKVD